MGALVLLMAAAAGTVMGAASSPAPLPIAFQGFAADPLDRMAREGVRVVVQQTVDGEGHTVIAVRVYDRGHDVYGDEFWQERVSLCPGPQPVAPVYQVQPTLPEMILFDRFHPEADSEEPH